MLSLALLLAPLAACQPPTYFYMFTNSDCSTIVIPLVTKLLTLNDCDTYVNLHGIRLMISVVVSPTTQSVSSPTEFRSFDVSIAKFVPEGDFCALNSTRFSRRLDVKNGVSDELGRLQHQLDQTSKCFLLQAYYRRCSDQTANEVIDTLNIHADKTVAADNWSITLCLGRHTTELQHDRRCCAWRYVIVETHESLYSCSSIQSILSMHTLLAMAYSVIRAFAPNKQFPNNLCSQLIQQRLLSQPNEHFVFWLPDTHLRMRHTDKNVTVMWPLCPQAHIVRLCDEIKYLQNQSVFRRLQECPRQPIPTRWACSETRPCAVHQEGRKATFRLFQSEGSVPADGQLLELTCIGQGIVSHEVLECRGSFLFHCVLSMFFG